MANVPRIVVEAFDILDDGSRVSSGMLDLTFPLVRDMTPYETSQPRRSQMPPLVMTISSSLSEDQRKRAYASKLAIPGIEVAYDKFLEEIGGLEEVREFRMKLDKDQQLTSAVSEARAQEEAVHAAALKSLGEFQMVTPLHGFRDYLDADEVDDAYDDFEWDEYVKEHPQPSFDSPAYQVWSDERRAWTRRNAPPLVFGTTPIEWKGVRPADVRKEHRENGSVDVDSMICGDLENHYEDAFEDVKDTNKVHQIIDAWLPHATRGTPEDLALETELAAWNGRQRIVSYSTTQKMVAPAFPDATKEEMNAWATRKREEAERRLAEFRLAWSTSFDAEHPAPAV